MPRLSLYRPEKGNDYKFQDKTVWEMFQVGGTDVYVHKYAGAGTSTEDTPSTPTYNSLNPLNIQDLLFLENRDRKYEDDVYLLRGVYNVQDIDFNLSQFGLFLQNDTIFITFHINDTVEKLGRKLIAGDVIELPHLKDEYALNDLQFALKRFYVIEDINRAAEGFSNTWYPHLYRAKCKPLVDSQEFKDILDGIADREKYTGPYDPAGLYYPGDILLGADGKKYKVLNNENTINGISGIAPPNAQYYELAETLKEIMSTYEKEMQITQAVLDQAESDAPKSGYDTSKYFTLKKDEEGNIALTTTDNTNLDASIEVQATDANGAPLVDDNGNPVYTGVDASIVFDTPDFKDYDGSITEDGLPPNGAPFSSGIAFPFNPVVGMFALRTDYLPNRLFRYDGARWIKIEDNLRITMSNLGASDTAVGADFEGKDIRQTQKTSFINNPTTSTIDGKTVKQKQSLSKALRPKADE